MRWPISRARRNGLYTALALLAVGGFAAASGLAGNTTAPTSGDRHDSVASQTTTTPDTPGKNYGASLSKAFREAAQHVLPSVVMITNTPKVAKVERQQGSARGERTSPNRPSAPIRLWANSSTIRNSGGSSTICPCRTAAPTAARG